jgi:competence ComEA-like helix-hairpin-helix protein
MRIESSRRTGGVVSLLCLSAMVFVLAGAVAVEAQAPQGDGRQATFESLCGSCHSTQLATSTRRTRAQWLQTVNQMVARGAPGTDEQLMSVVDYLSERYGRVNVNTASVSELQSIGGFTPEQAAAIVSYRHDHGSIGNLAELSRVTGVAESKLSANGEAFTFGTELPGVGRVPVSALTQSNNWPTTAGSPQRDGWAQGEEMISPETVAKMKLVYKRKLQNQSRGLRSLTSPLILGTLIGYQGFKQMLILGGSSDNVYSIDADLNREIWSRHFDTSVKPSSDPPGCAPALSAVVMPGSTAGRGFGGQGIRRPNAQPGGGGGRGASPFAGGFGRTGPVVVLTSDGDLRVLYQSNGADARPPVKFVPAGSLVSGFNLDGTTLYAATLGNCGGPNALYAVDLQSENSKVVSFPTNGSGAGGSAGTAIGNDGTVYMQVAEGKGAVAGNYNDTVLAMTPGDLNVKDFFTPPGNLPPLGKEPGPQGITPMVFSWKNKDLILAGARDGRLYLLDSASLGGADHHTPLYRSEPIATPGVLRESFATWEDPNTNTRWVYVSLWGPAAAGAKPAARNGDAPDGSIAAFKVEERQGKPVLTLAWTSRNIVAPSGPVTANGVVFTLSTGLPSRLTKADGSVYSPQELESQGKPAVLYALDALTGKELFRSENASSFSFGSGLAVANGHVYFTTHDNTVYAYGFPMEH